VSEQIGRAAELRSGVVTVAVEEQYFKAIWSADSAVMTVRVSGHEARAPTTGLAHLPETQARMLACQIVKANRASLIKL
jgi:hypothetical protein